MKQSGVTARTRSRCARSAQPRVLAVRGGLVATGDVVAPSMFAEADDAPDPDATDFGPAARLGPRRFTDHSGRSALEQSASEGGVVLHATGILLGGDLPYPFRTDPRPLSLFYRGGAYREANGRFHSRRGLFNLAAADDLLLTITARLGHLTGYGHPQPTLRPLELPVLPMFPGGRPAEFPELHANTPRSPARIDRRPYPSR